MRHHCYEKDTRKHVYACPVKRMTHRDGKALYVTHLDECPRKEDCAPQNTMGPLVSIKSETDPRLFPPIVRDSKQFKDIMNLRSGVERVNSLNDTYRINGAHRNADYGLIRLTLVNIIEHAQIRYRETTISTSAVALFLRTLCKIGVAYPQKYRDTG